VQTPRTRIQLQSVPVTAFLNRLSRGGEWTALRAEVENSHSTAEIEEEEARARYMSGMKDTQKQEIHFRPPQFLKSKQIAAGVLYL
jgi:hypothetical protein